MAAAGKWNSKNTTVTIADSTGVYSMTVGPGEGNLTISGIMEDNSEAIQTMDRGVHDGFDRHAFRCEWPCLARRFDDPPAGRQVDQLLPLGGGVFGGRLHQEPQLRERGRHRLRHNHHARPLGLIGAHHGRSRQVEQQEHDRHDRGFYRGLLDDGGPG